MLGVIYFADGHTEEVMWHSEHIEADLVVGSASGTYAFCEYVVMHEDPYFNYKTYRFYKWNHELNDWLVTLDIDYIEIHEE